MKKQVSVYIIVGICAILVGYIIGTERIHLPTVQENYDFRCAYWGDSLETVLKNDTELRNVNVVKSNNMNLIEGVDTVFNYEAKVKYIFFDNKFHTGTYDFYFKSEKEKGEIYSELNGILTEKYSEPFISSSKGLISAWQLDNESIGLNAQDDSIFMFFIHNTESNIK